MNKMKKKVNKHTKKNTASKGPGLTPHEVTCILILVLLIAFACIYKTMTKIFETFLQIKLKEKKMKWINDEKNVG